MLQLSSVSYEVRVRNKSFPNKRSDFGSRIIVLQTFFAGVVKYQGDSQ